MLWTVQQDYEIPERKAYTTTVTCNLLTDPGCNGHVLMVGTNKRPGVFWYEERNLVSFQLQDNEMLYFDGEELEYAREQIDEHLHERGFLPYECRIGAFGVT